MCNRRRNSFAHTLKRSPKSNEMGTTRREWAVMLAPRFAASGPRSGGSTARPCHCRAGHSDRFLLQEWKYLISNNTCVLRLIADMARVTKLSGGRMVVVRPPEGRLRTAPPPLDGITTPLASIERSPPSPIAFPPLLLPGSNINEAGRERDVCTIARSEEEWVGGCCCWRDDDDDVVG